MIHKILCFVGLHYWTRRGAWLGGKHVSWECCKHCNKMAW